MLVDRLQVLTNHYGVIYNGHTGGLHGILDEIDKESGMDTVGGKANVGFGYQPVNTVGARVARHERRLADSTAYTGCCCGNCR